MFFMHTYMYTLSLLNPSVVPVSLMEMNIVGLVRAGRAVFRWTAHFPGM